ELRGTIPELPSAARARLAEAGADTSQAAAIVGNGMLGVFDDAVAAGTDARTAANWLAGDVAGQLTAAGLELDESGFTGANLAELVSLVDDGTLSTTLAK